MAFGKLQLIKSRAASQLSSSTLPEKTERKQVAAVCYRLRHASIEFLLVRTRKQRWTFPKGGIKPGLSRAEAAALEAFEEAGVHGRIEEACFAKYTLFKNSDTNSSSQVTVFAHLCEVSELSPSREPGRNPTWFVPEEAKRRLRSERSTAQGAEFVRVVERALARIHRIRRHVSDPMQQVQFEASEIAEVQTRTGRAAFFRYRRQKRNASAIIVAGEAVSPKVVRLLPGRISNHNSQ